MRRFVLSVLGVTVFCIGLGALVENVGAKFKSDERAVALIKQARIAIGGEQSIAEIRSMIVKGNTSVTFKIDGANRTEQGETEIAMQLPDKLSKMVKIGRHEGPGGEALASKQHDVIIMRKAGEGPVEGAAPGQRVIVKKVEGETPPHEIVVTEKAGGEWKTQDGKTVVLRKAEGSANEEKTFVRHGAKGDATFERHHQNELLRMTLALLLTAPDRIDVNYTLGGEGDVDGTPCNIVNAEAAGSTFKLYLSKASSLPVAVSYMGHSMPRVMIFKTKSDEVPAGDDKVVTFNHKVDAPELVETQIKFGDFRGVNGVQLPYKWTTVVGGQTTEVLEVSGYEVNPANIADKFQNRKVMMKMKEAH